MIQNGSEIRVMKTRSITKIQAAEMKFLRGVLGVSRLDIIRNEEILNIVQIYRKIEEGPLRLFRHVSNGEGQSNEVKQE